MTYSRVSYLSPSYFVTCLFTTTSFFFFFLFFFLITHRTSFLLSAEKITEQSLLALEEAAVAIMVCDGLEGVNELDVALASYIRKRSKTPLYLAVNKCESETKGIVQAQEFWSLGLGNPYPVSGIHGTGLGDLLDEITTKHMTKVE